MEIFVKDFSEYPGLRNCNISDKSGEEFYHTVLNQAFKEAYAKKEKLVINLDNTAGYASSFLDEALGNLVFDFSLKTVKEYLVIISQQEPHWKNMIENQTFLQWEKRRTDRENPKVTKLHQEWYRLVNNQLTLKIWEQPVV
jgi:hypothetical protein